MHHKRGMTVRPILFACLLLVACGSGKPAGNRTASAAPADPTIPAPGVSADDGKVDCAVDGAAEFAHVCTIERNVTKDGLTLTVRAPSGSFRRLLVTKDGSGVAAADGAEPAKVTVVGAGRIEVALAGDRYRLPATVKQ